MLLVRNYQDVKDRLSYLDKHVLEILDKNGNPYKIFRNINYDFFQYDYCFNKLKESQAYFYELRFDKEVKGIFKTLFVDKKKELENIIVLNESEKDESSEIFLFNLDKIYSYNDFFASSNGKTYYNSLRDKYKEEIKKEYLKNKDNIDRFLRMERIEIEIDFIINYRQKDIDNITKPFIDILYNVAGLKNDNNIYKIISSKSKNLDNNEEYILLRIKKILKKCYEKSLMDEYLTEKC